jgi:hypothetical protein
LVREALGLLRELLDQDKAAVLWDAMRRQPETIPSFVRTAEREARTSPPTLQPLLRKVKDA